MRRWSVLLFLVALTVPPIWAYIATAPLFEAAKAPFNFSGLTALNIIAWTFLVVSAMSFAALALNLAAHFQLPAPRHKRRLIEVVVLFLVASATGCMFVFMAFT